MNAHRRLRGQRDKKERYNKRGLIERLGEECVEVTEISGVPSLRSLSLATRSLEISQGAPISCLHKNWHTLIGLWSVCLFALARIASLAANVTISRDPYRLSSGSRGHLVRTQSENIFYFF